MAKKPPYRADPFDEGAIQDLYRYFFGRLIHYKPEGLSIKDWMEEVFGVKYRDISCYVCTKPFIMPGLFYAAGAVKVQGMGYRYVEPGDQLYVRQDVRSPDSVDVEINSGQGKRTQVFNMDGLQWERTRLSLEPYRRPERKKRGTG